MLLRIPRGVAGALERQDRDLRGTDVVGMAVPAEVVVAHDDLRSELAHDAHQAAGGLVDVRGPEVAARSFAGVPIIPESTIAEPPGLDRAQVPRVRAAAPRRADSRRRAWFSGVSSSGTTISPCSPPVQVTQMTR